MAQPLQPVDHNALRVNQAVIVLLSTLAFVVNWPGLVLAVAACMLLGSLVGKPGFGFIYALLRYAGLLKPHVLPDHPQPHRFAQGFGGTVLLVAGLLLLYQSPVAGWSLTWMVIALAAINLFSGFCAGCFIYFWLGRLGVPGFRKLSPAGPFPGLRPTGGEG